MSAETAFTRSWPVGRYTATLEAPRSGAVLHAVITWSPQLPGGLSDEEIEAYRVGRDAAMAALAKHIRASTRKGR